MIESIVLEIVGGLITTLVAIGVAYFTRKTGIKIDAEVQALATENLTRQAEKAVAYAEEITAETLKNHEILKTSSEKLEVALDYIDATLPVSLKKQLGERFTEAATKEIEAALARIVNIGATKSNAYLPKL